MSQRDLLFQLVRQIPRGRVTSYGALAQALPQRVPAVLVGKWMYQAPSDVPWWRVIGANGHLPIAKHDPALAETQRKLLENEGIRFSSQDSVPREFFYFDFFLGSN